MTELELLQAFLKYEPTTGTLRWNAQREQMDDESDQKHKSWLTRHAGRPVGCVASFGGHQYHVFKLRKKQRYAHHVVWMLTHQQDIPPGHHVVALDNNYLNLRADNFGLAQANARQGRTTSGVRGVSWDSGNEKWVVQVRGRNCGRFESFDDAVACRLAIGAGQ